MNPPRNTSATPAPDPPRPVDKPMLFCPVSPADPERFPIPTDEECRRHWDECAVPDHIREHSRLVGLIAGEVGRLGEEAGAVAPGIARAARASGLLHDVAKLYCVEHGGNHAQLGAAWIRARTGNPAIAQGVLHHVWWPFDVDPTKYFLPLVVQYADKRVRHQSVVSVGARFADLFERYGKNDFARERIKRSHQQGQAIENTLSELLEVPLHACAFDSGRLVVRT